MLESFIELKGILQQYQIERQEFIVGELEDKLNYQSCYCVYQIK